MSESLRSEFKAVPMDNFHILTVMKYLKSGEDVLNVMSVKKAFREVNERMHENPVNIETPYAKKLFEHVQTVVVYDIKTLEKYYKEIIERKTGKTSYFDVDKNEDVVIENELSEKEQRQLNKLSTEGDLVNVSMYSIGSLMIKEFPAIHDIKLRFDRNPTEHLYLNEFLKKNDPVETQIQAIRHENPPILTVPVEWQVIPKESFSYLDMQQIVFNTNLKIIRDNAFTGCRSLQSVTIPASVMYLGRGVFSWSSLTVVKFAPGSQLQYIGEFCFAGTEIDEIVIPESCETIKYEAFWGCQYLREVTLPTHMLYLDESAFYECRLNWIKNLPINMRQKVKSVRYL